MLARENDMRVETQMEYMYYHVIVYRDQIGMYV